MRTLTYYIATSLDGFVCRHDGGISDFSFDGEHVADLLSEYPETIPTHLRDHINVARQPRHFDTVLMGRGTYEVGLQAGFASPYQHLRQYVFSRTLTLPEGVDVNLVQDNAVAVVRKLKSEDGMGVWLCGGPSLASVLLDEIDEIVIKVNPFLMGAGKSLFAGEFPKRDLHCIERRDYANGFSLARFSVPR